ncbi:FAD-dependent oxidoreductase [Hyphococcus sp.]|jgi:glycine/D-amino acid oxidase-like deaminating enzyme|uniref:FAD-dependent oxidoreductase n=1 Tax=Hyphococcus sp. TaxID=2038636 RepID=UPI003D125758
MLQRRQLLTAAALSPAAAALPLSTLPMAARAADDSAKPFDAPYAPVLSQPSREIRTVVGLRPYRSNGFRLEHEKFGRRDVIHNYGHGGCGVTLSWGCAQLSVELAEKIDDRRAAVIGSGVNGLTTALLLLRRGYEVSVYGAALPPYTTSNIAGAYWHPTTLYDGREAISDEFVTQFLRAARIAQRAFQHLANDPRYGVYYMRYLGLREKPPLRERTPYFEGDDLYAGLAVETDPERYFGYGYVERHHALMIDPDIYLRALMRDVENAGGRIVQKSFKTADDIFDLKEKLIFNCTGLGARELFGDETLGPARGQLTMLLPQPEVDYGYVNFSAENGLLYMFPRKGAILLGGTVEHGQWSLEPDETERLRMLSGHAMIAQRIAEHTKNKKA